MRVIVDVAKWYDWEVRHTSDLVEGAVTAPAIGSLGPNLHMMRVERDRPKEAEAPEPSQTTIDIPDSDIAGMYEEHKQGVADAAQGGFPHPVTGEPVAPRALPQKTAKQLLAEHIEFVMAQHAPAQHITDVHVPSHPAFEAYLRTRLVGGSAGDADKELLAGPEADLEVLGVKPKRSKGGS